MDLLNVQGDQVTVTLGPDDCLLLAQACAASSAYRGSDTALARCFGLEQGAAGATAVRPLERLYSAWADLFRLGCIAGADYRDLDRRDLPDICDRLNRAERMAAGKEA